jgi:hypothetical protein
MGREDWRRRIGKEVGIGEEVKQNCWEEERRIVKDIAAGMCRGKRGKD